MEQGWKYTTVKLSPELHHLAKTHGLNVSECTRAGIRMRLADRMVQDYDENLPLVQKLHKALKKLEEASQDGS